MTAPALMPRDFKTLSDAFINAKEYQARAGNHSPANRYAVDLGLPFSRKAAGDPVDIVSIGTAVGQPVGIPLGLIDFIPEVRVNDTSLAVPYETALGTEFAPVLSAAAKPAVTWTYTTVTLPLETIAGWCKLSTRVLDDAHQAGYAIENDLLKGVRRAEENQIINGNGTSPQLKGVLSTGTGIATAAGLGAAIAAVGAAGYTANMVLVNPADLEKIRVTGSTAGASNYDPIRQVTILFGVAVVTSIAVPVGTGIVGDWQGASMIWRRWDARVVVGLVNDDILKNLVTVVGESRLAFLVTHPTGFNKFTIT